MFDFSIGFKRPNDSNRSPGASFAMMTKSHNLTNEKKERFLGLCTDFLVEILLSFLNIKGEKV